MATRPFRASHTPVGLCIRAAIMIRSFRGKTPEIAASAYVDASAQVIGDVAVGERSSIWCNVSARGDVNSIHIGDETSIQDNTVLHVDYAPEFRLQIGNRVTVGHRVVLHGCTVEDDALIGIGAIVLNGATVGRGSIVAAGALVPEGMEIPANSLAMGVPAKIRRPVSPEECDRFRANVDHYVLAARLYKEEQS